LISLSPEGRNPRKGIEISAPSTQGIERGFGRLPLKPLGISRHLLILARGLKRILLDVADDFTMSKKDNPRKGIESCRIGPRGLPLV